MRAARVKNRIWDTPQIKVQMEEDFERDLEVMRKVLTEEPAESLLPQKPVVESKRLQTANQEGIIVKSHRKSREK